jgi:hypothetical protein
MRSLSWQETLTRLLFVVSGGVAALLLMREGAAEALPAIAVGGSIGACLMRSFDRAEDE